MTDLAETGVRSDFHDISIACSQCFVVPKVELDLEKYHGSTHAGHCMIYSISNDKIFDEYSARANVLMQMRFDGRVGFPGGLIDEGEDVLVGLNRELVEEMNVDVHKNPVKEEHYVVTHWWPSKKLLLHFYALGVSLEDLKDAEQRALMAHDYGTETLGTFRVPLFTMVDGYRGLPAFLSNTFAGNSREQLLYSLQHLSIMTKEEITKAVEAKPRL